MTDVEVDYVSSETLALRKALGPGSDVTGYVIVKVYGVYVNRARFASYSDVRAKARLIFVFVVCIGDINATTVDVAADGVSSETLALRKELGPGSDVTESNMVDQVYGEAWVTSMFQGKSMHMIRLRREFGFNSDGECSIQFQDYSVAKVISMMRLEFQATGPR
ncbi:Fer-1-Like Protein 5 [Manis pentadactyla]|nr:Fer-1-Like Protein 5 [Manis pentadactyla]